MSFASHSKFPRIPRGHCRVRLPYVTPSLSGASEKFYVIGNFKKGSLNFDFQPAVKLFVPVCMIV